MERVVGLLKKVEDVMGELWDGLGVEDMVSYIESVCGGDWGGKSGVDIGLEDLVGVMDEEVVGIEMVG